MTEILAGDPCLQSAVRLIRILIAVAHADGLIDDVEVDLFEDVLTGLPLPEDAKSQLRTELHAPASLRELCRGVDSDDERSEIMTLALRMALSDGHYCEKEQALIAQMAGWLYPKPKAKPNVQTPSDGPGLARPQKVISVSGVRTDIAVRFHERPLPGTTLFDIESLPGAINVSINTNHPASHLFVHSEGRDGLEYLLLSWATLEESSGDHTKQIMEDMRHDWGRALRDVVQRLVAEPVESLPG